MNTQIKIGNILDQCLEMTERKGIGHPDTMCDEITERISVALCQYYIKECGIIMHHNVDKALLIGGQAKPAYLGGRVIKPISLILAGRATDYVGDQKVPVAEIAIETAKEWFKTHLKHLNVDQHVEVQSKISPGSTDLVELYNRIAKGECPLANDTSFGAGYFPYSELDQKTIQIEQLLNSEKAKEAFPFLGEDIKVLGYRSFNDFQFTIAIAMIDRYIRDIRDYQEKIGMTKSFILDNLGIGSDSMVINNADNYTQESIYLTVTGTSAENGDDGQVGRGNRINGLITPYRPMSLEATSGKNPVSHVGKIYNYFARDLSQALVENQFAEQSQVFMVSQIGKPISQPQGIHIRLQNQMVNHEIIHEFVKDRLLELPNYWVKILTYREEYSF